MICQTCDRETRDDAYVCDSCADKASRALGDIPWLADQLEITIAKQRAAGSQAGGPSAETPLVFNLAASDKRDRLKSCLVSAVRFCTEEGVRNQSPHQGWPANDLVSLSRWLIWRVDGLMLNDMGGEFLADICRAVDACRRVIDLPPERSYSGPCPECGRDLYPRKGAAVVCCSGCGQRWDAAEVKEWARGRTIEHLERQPLVTAQEGQTFLSYFDIVISQETIHKWRERGLIAEHGHRNRRKLYRWDDLLAVASRGVKAS